MVRPERRTKLDIAVTALMMVAVLVGITVLWLHSDARATQSQTATPAPPVPPAQNVPDRLTEAWRAASPATPQPVVAGPTVVTAGGDEVLGRDPMTGQVRWRYARNIPLCTVGSEWGSALAVYRKSLNCSEVTSLHGSSGVRGPQRTSDAAFGTRLLTDGTYTTATGQGLLETWRDDLVATQVFGVPIDTKNPNNGMQRPQCRYSSIGVGDERLGVVEQCPGEGGRITMLNAKPKDDEKPGQVFSTQLGDADASVVAVTDQRVAVLLRDRSEVEVYNTAGRIVDRFPARLGKPDYPDNVRVEPTVNAGMLSWYTGADTVVLDPRTLTPRWTAPETLGPGTVFGNKVILPVRQGLAVANPETGAIERVIPVDRQGYSGRITLSSVGTVLLEQRGDTVVALH